MMGIVTAVSLLVYGIYIVLTVRGRKFLVSSQLGRRIQQVTGLTLIGSGVVVASR
jgi:threonine/homoserine/homoserine lactone efflux protein